MTRFYADYCVGSLAYRRLANSFAGDDYMCSCGYVTTKNAAVKLTD
jgi:hypothetical protein